MTSARVSVYPLPCNSVDLRTCGGGLCVFGVQNAFMEAFRDPQCDRFFELFKIRYEFFIQQRVCVCLLCVCLCVGNYVCLGNYLCGNTFSDCPFQHKALIRKVALDTDISDRRIHHRYGCVSVRSALLTLVCSDLFNAVIHHLLRGCRVMDLLGLNRVFNASTVSSLSVMAWLQFVQELCLNGNEEMQVCASSILFRDVFAEICNVQRRFCELWIRGMRSTRFEMWAYCQRPSPEASSGTLTLACSCFRPCVRSARDRVWTIRYAQSVCLIPQ